MLLNKIAELFVAAALVLLLAFTVAAIVYTAMYAYTAGGP